MRNILGGNEASFDSVCTRLTLRIGVNLRDLKLNQMHDQGLLEPLEEMGYVLS